MKWMSTAKITPFAKRAALFFFKASAAMKTLFFFACATLLSLPVFAQNNSTSAPPEPVKLAFVGASITAGYGTQNHERDSYPAQLARMLGDAWQMRNFGVSATTLIYSGDVPYIRTEAYQKALQFAPAVLVIDLGGNDSKPQNFEAHPDDFVPDYKALAAAFRKENPRVKIYAALPVPAFPENFGIRDKIIIEKIIPAIRQAAKEANLSVIDLHTPMVNRAVDFADKVHPNEAAAKTMAETIFEVFKKDFPNAMKRN